MAMSFIERFMMDRIAILSAPPLSAPEWLDDAPVTDLTDLNSTDAELAATAGWDRAIADAPDELGDLPALEYQQPVNDPDEALPPEEQRMKVARTPISISDQPVELPERSENIDDIRSKIRDTIRNLTKGKYYASELDVFRRGDDGYEEPFVLVTAKPGVGKTWAAAKLSVEMSARTLFLSERKDGFETLTDAAKAQDINTGDFIMLKPRFNYSDDPTADPYLPQPGDGCIKRRAMMIGLSKGYDSIDICKAMCRFSYISSECAHLAQRDYKHNVQVGRHEHITTGTVSEGHLLVIGDENPIKAFLNEIVIAQKDLPLAKPRTAQDKIMRALNDVFVTFRQGKQAQRDAAATELAAENARIEAENERRRQWNESRPVNTKPRRMLKPKKLRKFTERARLSGPELIEAMGGADEVLALYEDMRAEDYLDGFINIFRDLLTDPIRGNTEPTVEDIERAKSCQGDTVLAMLRKEAELIRDGQTSFIERVFIDDAGLHLLSRKAVNERLRQLPFIWFDGTGTKELYEELFQRPVTVIDGDPTPMGKIIQIAEHTNNMLSVVNADKTPKLARTKLLDLQIAAIERIEGKKAAVITYSALVEALSDGGSRETMYFYNQRGSNDLERCDALVVIGAPCPPMDSVVRDASMIYQNETTPFDDRWITVDRPFLYSAPDGKARIGQVSEFADPRLNVLLRERRDNEMIQAIHRARIVSRYANVYMISSVPVQGLVIDRLITIPELVGMPEQKDANIGNATRLEGRELAYQIMQEKGKNFVEVSDLREAGLSRAKAMRLVRDLADDPEWEPVTVRGTSGRPPTGYKPRDP
ncbi:MAG: hypothetical protein R2867_05345 [Caldilineaceae bacterium]